MLNHQLTPAVIAERASSYEGIAAAYGVPSLDYAPRLRTFLEKRPAFVRQLAEQWLNTSPVWTSASAGLTEARWLSTGSTADRPTAARTFPGRQMVVRLPDGVPTAWYINGERAADAAELRLTVDRPLAITAGGDPEAADRPPSVAAAPLREPPGAPLVWRRIQGDGFMAGCVTGRDGRCHTGELPRERVNLTHAYGLTATEVTVAQFRTHARLAGAFMPRQPW